MSSPLLVLDDRQPKWMDKHLQASGFNVHVARLETADFVWDSRTWGRVGVEDKTPSDLASSRTSGRLDDQLRRLTTQFDLAFLFIRGDIKSFVTGLHFGKKKSADPDEVGGFPPHMRTFSAMDNMLIGRQMRGVMVVHCNAKKKIGDRLMSLYEYTQRPKPQDAPVFEAHYPYQGVMTDKAEVIYRMLASVPSIRGKREIAEKLAAQFPLFNLLQWEADDWREEGGFTKKMATKL